MAAATAWLTAMLPMEELEGAPSEGSDQEWQPEVPGEVLPLVELPAAQGVAAEASAEEAAAGPHAVIAELKAEMAAWHVDFAAWVPLEGAPPAVLEHRARRRFYDELDAADKGTRGVDMRVDLYDPDNFGVKQRVDFATGLARAYGTCVEAFARLEDPTAVLKSLSHCVFISVSFLAQFMQLRFQHHCTPSFQVLLELLIRPKVGATALVRGWVACQPEERRRRGPALIGDVIRTVTAFLDSLREVRRQHIVTDAAVNTSLDVQIERLAAHCSSASQEELDMLLPAKPRIEISNVRGLALGTKILFELRVAWAERRFQLGRRELQAPGPRSPEELRLLKAGRHGLFGRHYGILEGHGFQPGPRGVVEFCTLLDVWCASDETVRKLANEIKSLSTGVVAEEIPVVREVFAPGRRVWAFYDTYDQSLRWRYRYVKVSEPPSGWPLVGTSAGWLQGTVVARPEPSGNAVDGFQRVLVRFEGSWCDSRELDRHLSLRAGASPAFTDRARFWGRACCQSKDFLVPATLVRDLGDPPPQPLLSVLNLRPVDYYSNGKHSDYNICNDGYIEDLMHGPCSMREQLPGEYEVCSVFIKETGDLDRLDAQQLRSRLMGRNVIGWYLQWPQAQGRGAIWGNGSVRKQQFFEFCTRAERVPVRSGWPHPSHMYDLLASKAWLPRMSLCRDFKVPPTAVIHYAAFRRHPLAVARRALEHLSRLRQAVWGAAPTPVGEYKGVVKFGYSWCGTDVVPFVGLEALARVCEGMFHKEGCEHTTIMVQEMLPNVVAECRNLCFYDRLNGTYHKERLWVAQMQKYDFKAEGFSGMASSTVLPRDVVAKHCLAGDDDALRFAESEAERLCDRWLLWSRTESPEPLQCTRIDFLVARGTSGQARVWTCEVGECGGSLCSVEVHARNTVALNSAIRDDPSGRFPAPLHRPLMRNNGIKSI